MSNSENLSLSEMSDLAEESSQEAEVESRKAIRDKARIVLASVSGQGKWHLLQEYLIEIQADGKLKEAMGQQFPTFQDQLTMLHKKVELDFSDEPETRDVLLGYVTKKIALQKWSKLPGWNDAVLNKMKSYGLFTNEKRAEVINSMQVKAAKEGDVQAAKVWLTMSGDYTDKVDVSDAKFEKYKEYANSLTSGVKVTDDK